MLTQLDVEIYAYSTDSLTVSATDIDVGDSIASWAATNADLSALDPLVFTFDTTTGLLDIHPPDNTFVGDYDLTITATDSDPDGTGPLSNSVTFKAVSYTHLTLPTIYSV